MFQKGIRKPGAKRLSLWILSLWILWILSKGGSKAAGAPPNLPNDADNKFPSVLKTVAAEIAKHQVSPVSDSSGRKTTTRIPLTPHKDAFTSGGIAQSNVETAVQLIVGQMDECVNGKKICIPRVVPDAQTGGLVIEIAMEDKTIVQVGLDAITGMEHDASIPASIKDAFQAVKGVLADAHNVDANASASAGKGALTDLVTSLLQNSNADDDTMKTVLQAATALAQMTMKNKKKPYKKGSPNVPAGAAGAESEEIADSLLDFIEEITEAAAKDGGSTLSLPSGELDESDALTALTVFTTALASKKIGFESKDNGKKMRMKIPISYALQGGSGQKITEETARLLGEEFANSKPECSSGEKACVVTIAPDPDPTASKGSFIVQIDISIETGADQALADVEKTETESVLDAMKQLEASLPTTPASVVMNFASAKDFLEQSGAASDNATPDKVTKAVEDNVGPLLDALAAPDTLDSAPEAAIQGAADVALALARMQTGSKTGACTGDNAAPTVPKLVEELAKNLPKADKKQKVIISGIFAEIGKGVIVPTKAETSDSKGLKRTVSIPFKLPTMSTASAGSGASPADPNAITPQDVVDVVDDLLLASYPECAADSGNVCTGVVKPSPSGDGTLVIEIETEVDIGADAGVTALETIEKEIEDKFRASTPEETAKKTLLKAKLKKVAEGLKDPGLDVDKVADIAEQHLKELIKDLMKPYDIDDRISPTVVSTLLQAVTPLVKVTVHAKNGPYKDDKVVKEIVDQMLDELESSGPSDEKGPVQTYIFSQIAAKKLKVSKHGLTETTTIPVEDAFVLIPRRLINNFHFFQNIFV